MKLLLYFLKCGRVLCYYSSKMFELHKSCGLLRMVVLIRIVHLLIVRRGMTWSPVEKNAGCLGKN